MKSTFALLALTALVTSPASAEIISYKYVGTLSGYAGSQPNPATIYVQYDLSKGKLQTSSDQNTYAGGSQLGTPNFATGYFTIDGVKTTFNSTFSANIDATLDAFNTDFFLPSGLPSPLTSANFSLNSYYSPTLGQGAAFKPGTYNYETNDFIALNSLSGTQQHTFYNVTLTIATVGEVSSVPLPASAPMFGAALTAVGAVGYVAKRKAKTYA